jgi:hypothetical protein
MPPCARPCFLSSPTRLRIEVPSRSKFTQADRDADGVLTFSEWIASLGAPADLYARARWAKFDTEGKGFLTAQEVFERRAA